MGRYKIAIDIGGTFTDGVMLDVETGMIWLEKSLTTPSDPGEAVTRVAGALLAQRAREAGVVTRQAGGPDISSASSNSSNFAVTPLNAVAKRSSVAVSPVTLRIAM